MSELKRWLSGVFEPGGGMGFHIRSSRKYAYPYMQFTDVEYDRVLPIAKTLEGSRLKHLVNGSWSWQPEGANVAELTLGMEDYSPWRKGMISSFQSWLTESLTNRLMIALSIQANQRTVTSAQDYQDLLLDPVFISGVFDSRGNIYHTQRGERILYIGSENDGLLNALSQLLGVLPRESIHDVDHHSKTILVSKEQTIEDMFSLTEKHAQYFQRGRFKLT